MSLAMANIEKALKLTRPDVKGVCAVEAFLSLQAIIGSTNLCVRKGLEAQLQMFLMAVKFLTPM